MSPCCRRLLLHPVQFGLLFFFFFSPFVVLGVELRVWLPARQLLYHRAISPTLLAVNGTGHKYRFHGISGCLTAQEKAVCRGKNGVPAHPLPQQGRSGWSPESLCCVTSVPRKAFGHHRHFLLVSTLGLLSGLDHRTFCWTTSPEFFSLGLFSSVQSRNFSLNRIVSLCSVTLPNMAQSGRPCPFLQGGSR